MGYIKATEETSVATPPAGNVYVYPKTDGKLYIKDDAGDEAPASLHPGTVTDVHIGARAIDQTLAGGSSTGVYTSFLGWIAKTLKAISGETNWYDTPRIARLKYHNTAATVTAALAASLRMVPGIATWTGASASSGSVACTITNAEIGGSTSLTYITATPRSTSGLYAVNVGDVSYDTGTDTLSFTLYWSSTDGSSTTGLVMNFLVIGPAGT
jgi:hypothetical protein